MNPHPFGGRFPEFPRQAPCEWPCLGPDLAGSLSRVAEFVAALPYAAKRIYEIQPSRAPPQDQLTDSEGAQPWHRLPFVLRSSRRAILARILLPSAAVAYRQRKLARPLPDTALEDFSHERIV